MNYLVFMASKTNTLLTAKSSDLARRVVIASALFKNPLRRAESARGLVELLDAANQRLPDHFPADLQGLSGYISSLTEVGTIYGAFIRSSKMEMISDELSFYSLCLDSVYNVLNARIKDLCSSGNLHAIQKVKNLARKLYSCALDMEDKQKYRGLVIECYDRFMANSGIGLLSYHAMLERDSFLNN